MHDVQCPNCGRVVEASMLQDVLPAGTRLGDFRIMHLLGAGGTGRVYLATQLSMGRPAAVKVLYPELVQDKSAVEQFFGEVRILGQIQHSSIACAYASGKENDLYYLAMQYVPGSTLEDVLKGTPMVETKVLEYAEVVAGAFQYVWQKHQLCHRDIKPGNIMINEDGMPVILDFGAALRSGSVSMRNGLVEGSPYYMSPEQARGEDLTFHSDMYSLGATLYQMLTGVPPFETNTGDLQEILRKHCYEELPAPEVRAPGVTLNPATFALLKGMMEKDPADRFESWDAFLIALKRAQKAVKTGEKQKTSKKKKKTVAPGRPKVMPQQKNNRGLLVTINTALACVLVIGVAGFVYVQNNNTKANNQLILAEEAYEAVKKSSTADPLKAIRFYKEAQAATKKFGVRQAVIDKIAKSSAVALRELEIQAKEDQVAQDISSRILLKVGEIAAFRGEYPELAKKNTPGLEKQMQAWRDEIASCMQELKKIDFTRPINQDHARQCEAQLNGELAALDALARKYDSPKEEKKPAAVVEDSGSSAQNVQVVIVDEGAQQEDEEKRKAEAAAQEKAIEKYTLEVRRAKVRIARELINLVRGRKYEEAFALLVMPKDMNTEEEFLKKQKNEFSEWLEDLHEIMTDAVKPLRDNERDTSRKTAIAIRVDKNLLDYQKFSALFMLGYFPDAEAVMEKDVEKWKPLMNFVARVYLAPRVKRAMWNANHGRTGELDDMRKEYRGYSVYEELESKAKNAK